MSNRPEGNQMDAKEINELAARLQAAADKIMTECDKLEFERAQAAGDVWDGTGDYAGQAIVPDFNRPASQR